MIVCADDFGLSADINDAILDLARAGRISAVSFLTTSRELSQSMRESLREMAGRLDLGLHFNLTEGSAISKPAAIPSLATAAGHFRGFKVLLLRSRFGQAVEAQVERELAAQYARFVEMAGRPPDFVDGHHHVQQYPGIREAVVAFVNRLPVGSRGYVRNGYQPLRKILRQGVSPWRCLWISLYGRPLRRCLIRAGLETNVGFAGVYDNRHERFPDLLVRFVANMEDDRGILMTHPGRLESWRRMEYETLRDAPCLTGRVNRYH